MKGFKGFDKDLKCRGFQFEIGKEYEEQEALLCNKGFHACEYPLDCFGYYSPADSRFCEVEIEDNGERQNSDTKVCGKKIKIGAEIGIKGLIKAAFEYTKERCTSAQQGADKTALTGGDSSALTGGDRSALTGGEFSVVYGGEFARVRGKKGAVLALQHWVDGEFVGVKVKAVDGKTIKEDIFYELKNGRFVKSKEQGE